MTGLHARIEPDNGLGARQQQPRSLLGLCGSIRAQRRNYFCPTLLSGLLIYRICTTAMLGNNSEGRCGVHRGGTNFAVTHDDRNRVKLAAQLNNALLSRSFTCIGKLIVMQQSERSEEHTSELQSLMRISYAVFCLKKKKK